MADPIPLHSGDTPTAECRPVDYCPTVLPHAEPLDFSGTDDPLAGRLPFDDDVADIRLFVAGGFTDGHGLKICGEFGGDGKVLLLNLSDDGEPHVPPDSHPDKIITTRSMLVQANSGRFNVGGGGNFSHTITTSIPLTYTAQFGQPGIFNGSAGGGFADFGGSWTVTWDESSITASVTFGGLAGDTTQSATGTVTWHLSPFDGYYYMTVSFPFTILFAPGEWEAPGPPANFTRINQQIAFSLFP